MGRNAWRRQDWLTAGRREKQRKSNLCFFDAHDLAASVSSVAGFRFPLRPRQLLHPVGWSEAMRERRVWLTRRARPEVRDTRMVVVLREDASAEERQAVGALLSDAGIAARAVRWVEHDLYIPEAALSSSLQQTLTALPAVERCVAVESPYVLASRELHPEKSLVRVGHAVFGGADPVLIAGPCSVEDEAQINEA